MTLITLTLEFAASSLVWESRLVQLGWGEEMRECHTSQQLYWLQEQCASSTSGYRCVQQARRSPMKPHILNPGLCTICTTENRRGPHLFFYYRHSLTRGIRHHSTSINAHSGSWLKPTHQNKKTLHCVVWSILKKVLKEMDSFLKTFPFSLNSTVSFWESMSSFSCFSWQSQNPEQNLHEKETNQLELFVSNLPLVLFSLTV